MFVLFQNKYSCHILSQKTLFTLLFEILPSEQGGFCFFQNLCTITLEDFSCKIMEGLNQQGLVNLNSVLPGVYFSLRDFFFFFPLKTNTQLIGRIFQVSVSMTKQRVQVPDLCWVFHFSSITSCCVEVDTSVSVSVLQPVLKSFRDLGLQFLRLAFNFSSLPPPSILSFFICAWIYI